MKLHRDFLYRHTSKRSSHCDCTKQAHTPRRWRRKHKKMCRFVQTPSSGRPDPANLQATPPPDSGPKHGGKTKSMLVNPRSGTMPARILEMQVGILRAHTCRNSRNLGLRPASPDYQLCAKFDQHRPIVGKHVSEIDQIWVDFNTPANFGRTRPHLRQIRTQSAQI